ncbi:hypothetical protein MBLNU13_g11315t1 [Cladosporium sp. NU13]
MINIAANLPRKFLDCVQRISLIQLGSDFTSDSIWWQFQLQTTEYRLRRWGEAAGILDEQSTPFWKQPDAGDDSQKIRQVFHALRQILKQLSRAREDSEDIVASGWRPSREQVLINKLGRLSLCESDAKEARHALEKLRSRNHGGEKLTPEVIESSMIPLHQVEQLQKLLDAIGDQVQVLETLFENQLKTLAAQETSSPESEAIQTLGSIFQRNPNPASASEAALPGHSRWRNILATKNAEAHLGSHCLNEPKGSYSWEGLVIKDYARLHAGNYIGYPEY